MLLARQRATIPLSRRKTSTNAFQTLQRPSAAAPSSGARSPLASGSVAGASVKPTVGSSAPVPSFVSPSLSRVATAAAPGSPQPTSSAASSSIGGKMEVATLGGGCFWCIEACYNMMKGVQSAVSGYAAGQVDNPTYKQVCSGTTGHAEVVQVTFDPAVVSYKDILRVLFTIHDPTTKDRQGNDVGTQYRSIILYHSEEQRRAAQEVMDEVSQEGWWSGPLVTQLEPLTTFYPAEDYHQNYFVQNPGQGYCRVVVGPKVAKFRSKFGQMLKEAA